MNGASQGKTKKRRNVKVPPLKSYHPKLHWFIFVKFINEFPLCQYSSERIFWRICGRSAADSVNATGIVVFYPYPASVDTGQTHRVVERPCAVAAPDGCCNDRCERYVCCLAVDEIDVYVTLFYFVIVHRATCHLVEPLLLGLCLSGNVAQDDVVGQHAAQLHRVDIHHSVTPFT